MTSNGRRAAAASGLLVLLLGGAWMLADGSAADSALAATARRTTLAITLTESGLLRAAGSTTYRSTIEGRELEITYLAPEGTQVKEGDLLAQLDTAAMTIEFERALQAVRQVELELHAAGVERQEAALALQRVTEGAGALAIDEGRTELRLAQARATRLREDHERLQPLLAKGYITREEFDRAALEVQEAEARALLAERAFQILVNRTHPGEEQAARLHVKRREAQLAHLAPRLDAAKAYAGSVAGGIERSAIRAARPGLVIHEDNLSTMPRRKVRVGDRVTPSQGLITLPDLRRMVVESSVRESDVHLLKPGQPARIRVDAFPELALTGRVAHLGVLTQKRTDAQPGDSRFDVLIELNGTTAPLRPAMNARVDIVVDERHDVLTVPASAVFMHDGVTICYVLRGSSIERRMVETGGSSGTEVEIRAGLRPGERVALTDQSSNPRGVTPKP